MKNSENQNINKRVFLQAKYFFLARLLQVILVFAILIGFSLILSKENYGLYQASWVFMNLFAPLIFLGLPQQLLTLPGNAVLTHLPWLFKKHLPYFILVGIILLATLLLVQQKLSIALLTCIFFCTILQAIMLMLDNLVLKLNADKLFLRQNLLYSLLFLLIHVSWLLLHGSVIWLIAAIGCISFIKSLRFFLFIRKQQWSKNAPIEDKIYFLQQWNQLSLNEIINRFSSNADKLVIIFLLSLSGFSVYYNGTYEIPFFAMLVTALGNSLSVQISNNLTHEKHSAQLFKQSLVMGSSVSFPLFFFFYLFSTPLFQFFLNGKYMDAVPLFNIAIFIAFLRITSFTAILQVFKKNKTILLGSVIDLLANITIVVILYPVLGIKAFPLGYILGTALQIAYYIVETTKILNVKAADIIPIKWLVALTLVLTLIYLILYKMVIALPNWATISIAAAITASLIYLLTRYFGQKSTNQNLRFL